MEDQDQYNRMKAAFYNKMEELINNKHFNNQIFTQAAYLGMIEKVEHAKSLKFGKTPSDYARLKKFDILEIEGCKRLVVPFFCSTTSSGNQTSGAIRMFVHVEEIFDLLHAAHIKIGHKGRISMTQEVTQFKNITREMIMVYLSICEVCQERIASKNQEKDPKVSCIDFIGMSTDGTGYNVILVHIDAQTHFVQLRALKNTDAVQLTQSLLDIFLIFGAPDVLQGNIDYELGKIIVNDIYAKWADFKIKFIKTEGIISLLEETKIRVNQLLACLTESNRNLEWSEGIKFVQYMKNKEYDTTLTRSASEAMFGNKFGKTVSRKRKSEVIDQTPSNTEEETYELVEETIKDVDTQNEVVKFDVSGKRTKVIVQPTCSNTSNLIIKEEIKTAVNTVDPESLPSW